MAKKSAHEIIEKAGLNERRENVAEDGKRAEEKIKLALSIDAPDSGDRVLSATRTLVIYVEAGASRIEGSRKGAAKTNKPRQDDKAKDVEDWQALVPKIVVDFNKQGRRVSLSSVASEIRRRLRLPQKSVQSIRKNIRLPD